jgi:DNA-binding LytR/AlgR family response regulator
MGGTVFQTSETAREVFACRKQPKLVPPENPPRPFWSWNRTFSCAWRYPIICGYKVLESSSDDDVLAVLNAASDIDVVFSGAPTTSESDGFALAHRIRIARPDVDVILTAGIENAATKAAEVCSDGPLTKTFNPKDLVKRIHLLRERHRTSKFSR